MNNKRSWLLLRGLVRSYKHWGDFPEHFKKLVPNDQVFFIDLPGNGESFRQESPTSISENALQIRKQALEKLQGTELNVIAISMGAMVVVEWMRLFPNDINMAFLINTSASNWSKPLERFQLNNVLKYFVQSRFRNAEANILKVSSNNYDRAKAYQKIFEDEAKEHPVKPTNAAKQLFAAGTFSFPETSPGNIQLIASEHDRLVKVSCSKAIAAQWKAPLLIHPTAGHDLPMDEPQWLSEKILELSKTPAGL